MNNDKFYNNEDYNNINIYFDNKYLYLELDDIRAFKTSIRRIKHLLNIKEDKIAINYIVKNKKHIFINLEKINNYFMSFNNTKLSLNNYLFNYSVKIKIKEINDYINIKKNDNDNTIIQKQYLKIISLIEKINDYEKILKIDLVNTDDELIFL